MLRGRREIDLITLDVKLTLRESGVSQGFRIDGKKKMRKTNEMLRKSNN